VGKGCRISRAIIDEDCRIPDGMVIGEDPARDAERFHVTENGVVLVTADMLRQTSLNPKDAAAAETQVESQAIAD
jgi:glucose-1-phosphate adenylyltransferase